MRRPGEYFATYRDGVLTAEYDAFACAHCNRSVFLKGGKDATADGAIVAPQPHWQSDGMGICLMCCGRFERGLLCPACHAEQNTAEGRINGKCKNFERQLEARERAETLYQAVRAA